MTTADTDAPLSMEEAVAAFTGASEATADDNANSDDNLEAEPDVGADDGQTEPDDDQDSESADPEEDGEPDDEGQPDDEDDDEQEEIGGGRFANDDAKVRLPDGTVLTIAQLKSGNLMDRDYRQKTMAHSEEVKAFQATRETVTKRESELHQQFEYTSKLLESLAPQAPQMPNVPYAVDPVAWGEYNTAKLYYDNFTQHQTYIQSQLEAAKAADKAKADETRNERLASSWEELTTLAPELKDPKNLESLVADIKDFGNQYGLSAEELGELPLNPKYVVVMRKAIAWDKLQAKQKAAKTGATPPEKRPPVQKGGKRLSGAEVRSREQKAAMDRLDKTGSVKDGVAAYLASQSQG